ncbi:hypothetical protein NL54_05690 [Pantoea stewartii]|nr:hypothetical protein NL54_05690 [Pantoea stewartii]KHN61788.1 hypothetical protein OI73_13035 [Pantoea stewartii]
MQSGVLLLSDATASLTTRKRHKNTVKTKNYGKIAWRHVPLNRYPVIFNTGTFHVISHAECLYSDEPATHKTLFLIYP